MELRIWLKQGKEKRLLARILKILEKARKRVATKFDKNVRRFNKKVCDFAKKVHKYDENVKKKT